MTDSINCNFARCAVKHFMSTRMKRNKLPKGAMPQIVRDYNSNFGNVQALQVTHKLASKKFLPILRLFNNKWHPQESKNAYLSVFSVDEWKVLPPEEKETHTISDCKACCEKFAAFSNAFPSPRRRGKKPIVVSKRCVNIELSEQDLSSSKCLGRKVLRELNTISQLRFQKSGEEVLVETPKSHIVLKPTSEEKRQSRRKIEKNMKDAIAREKENQASDIVLQNRISWRTYNKLRKAEGLTTTPKRPAEDSSEGEPSHKKRFANNLEIDKEKLLREAQTWSSNEAINWSHLAREYGVYSSNGGQMLKEYLQQHEIPAASIHQRLSRAPRRSKKRISACSNITMPMYPTVTKETTKLHKRIMTGEIVIGDEVVPTTYDYYSVDPETHILHANTVKVSARRIPLQKIREKLLEKHEKMGIMRDNSDEYFTNIATEDIVHHLNELKIPFNSSDDMRQKLKDACRTRYMKIWHDHSSIASHGYLLVLVSFIYDPAFYYTSEEMKALKGIDIDVPTTVEKPETHIIGRSSSSTQDQLMFIGIRKECLQQMRNTLKTMAGVEIRDIIRFFYGDGPAAQFEAGHKQGGAFCCVGCGAHSGRFADIAYCYRAPKQSLQERQQFVLQGNAWRKGG